MFAVAGVVRDAAAVWAGGLHSGWNARKRFAPHLHFVAVGGKLKYSVAIQAPSLGGERPLSAWLLISTWNGMAGSNRCLLVLLQPAVGLVCSVARVGARRHRGRSVVVLPWRDSWRGPKTRILLWGPS